MDALQDFMTTVALALEYFIFAYLAIAFVLYSFEWQSLDINKHKALPPTKQEPLIVPPPQEHPLLVAAG